MPATGAAQRYAGQRFHPSVSRAGIGASWTSSTSLRAAQAPPVECYGLVSVGRVARVDPTGSAGDLELWELHEELLREVGRLAALHKL